MSAVAILPQDDKSDLLREHRQKELELRRETYRQALSTVFSLTLHTDLILATFTDGPSGNQDSL